MKTSIIAAIVASLGYLSLCGFVNQLDEADKESKVVRLEANAPKTAAELLKRLEEEDRWQFHVPGKLSEEETTKAAAALRKKYPFKSIRERLSNKDRLAHSRSESEKHVASISSPWSLRHRALGELHSEQVHDFINRAGNGLSRMPVISPYNLRSWPSFDGQLEQRQADSDLFAERIIPLRLQPIKPNDMKHRYDLDGNGMPTIWHAESFNRNVLQGFASADSTGLIRSVDEVAGFESHRVNLFESWPGNMRMADQESLKRMTEDEASRATMWMANRLELVSLILNEEPRVYLSENLPNMEELSGEDVETRALNDFETSALEKLREGEELVTRATANRIVMMGAVRSTEHCTQCHTTKKGELLGAFSYEFLRDPKLELRINL